MAYQGTNNTNKTKTDPIAAARAVTQARKQARSPESAEATTWAKAPAAVTPIKPPKPEPVKPDDLPLVSCVSSRETMDALIEIMQTNSTLAEEMYWMTQAITANKAKAVALLVEEGLVGVRHGSLYVRIGEEETKKTLDLGLIALHFGLDLDEVKAHCMKESKPFRKTWVDDMAKPKRQKAATSEE